MDKKILTIIILSLVIIILVLIIVIGNNRTSVDFEQIRTERNNLIRSASIIENELERSLIESAELRENYFKTRENNNKLKDENRQLGIIINNLTTGSQETDKGLGKYGEINKQFADFIRRNGTEE